MIPLPSAPITFGPLSPPALDMQLYIHQAYHTSPVVGCPHCKAGRRAVR